MFRAVGLILSWLPVIVSTITAVEQIVGSGNGAEKKKVVTTALYRILEKANVNVSGPVKTIISAVIDGIVAVLNILGVSGFSDDDDADANVELLPAAYASEVAELEAAEEVELEDPLEVAEPSVKATPDEERMDELQKELEARIEDSTEE